VIERPSVGTYSLEILPFLQFTQSTLPAPGFHSSPNRASNSALVKPGGSRRQTSLRRGWAALGPRGACDGVFLCRAATGKRPLAPAWGGIFEFWWRSERWEVRMSRLYRARCCSETWLRGRRRLFIAMDIGGNGRRKWWGMRYPRRAIGVKRR
jgi:hypothetical protein